MNSVWEVLGIAATSDERAIKRAYAAKLRIHSPEKDAAGYMKLRDAYESAKAFAESHRRAAPRVEAPVAPQATVPETPATETPPPTPQQQAYAELHSLLLEHKLEETLAKIESIQRAQVFTTLDEQQDFIGSVALMARHHQIEDQSWLGRLAALLGAREGDNIFDPHTRYWSAYQRLLESHARQRNAEAEAHARKQDEFATSPGYLHVFHVLTAPFDSERLNALTRSQIYHRLAENILDRAKSDPTIRIPPENREWWDRTAMAGQHRPLDTPVAVAAAQAAPADGTGKFPGWLLWIVMMIVVQSFRLCDGTPDRVISPPTLRPDAPASLAVFSQFAACPPQVRVALFSYYYEKHGSPTQSSAAQPPYDKLLDVSDPKIAALLADCRR